MFVLSLGLQSPSPVSSRYSLLEGAFRETGRDHMHHCLELSSEMTCYVLQAGMINSPHSFLKNGWIIPHDWRAIVATRERLFLCETKAMVGEEMCYKFSVAAVHATSWTCGEWHVEPRHALEMLDPYLNSGERFDCWLVSGLGTLAVQSLLKTSWAEIKTNMSPIELALARVWEECNPAVLVSPRLPAGLIHPDRINPELFPQTPLLHLSDMLLLLDAGGGVQIDYLLQFVEMIEASAIEFWNQAVTVAGEGRLWDHWNRIIASGLIYDLGFKAELFVFWKAMELYPTLEALLLHGGNAHQFTKSLTGLSVVEPRVTRITYESC